MPPKTRAQYYRETTPPSTKRREFNTPKKAAFFNDYDRRHDFTSFRQIAGENQVNPSTAHRWLKEREVLGSPALRHTRKRSNTLGPRCQISKEQTKAFVDPEKNPIRDQHYEAQIQYFDVRNSNTGELISTRTLRRSLRKHTKNAQRYKQAYVKKILSPANIKQRTKYGSKYGDKPIEFWITNIYTDEAHIDPSSQAQGCILREEGTRTNTENIQQRGNKTGVKLHIAGWVCWYGKSEQLYFYNDENIKTVEPKMPRKPRKTMYESTEEFSYRLKEWEALRPHEVEVKPKGNAMTQKYYTEHLLPVYIDAVHRMKAKQPGEWRLVEDGDPSHGMRKAGLAQELREKNGIVTLFHPANSPDLNPIEACWNILKQRLRRRIWRDIEELKVILQEEWSKITIEQVRSRIYELLDRSKLLQKNGGKPIKSDKW